LAAFFLADFIVGFFLAAPRAGDCFAPADFRLAAFLGALAVVFLRLDFFAAAFFAGFRFGFLFAAVFLLALAVAARFPAPFFLPFFLVAISHLQYQRADS
jgi:hypothetical protein